MTHKITAEDLMNWIDTEVWHLAASSHGRGTSKKLEMSNGGIFRVTDHGANSYTGPNLEAAVKAYNAAP